MSKVALICLLLIAELGSAQITASCQKNAINQCVSQCGFIGECIFGCEIGGDNSASVCNEACDQLGDACLGSCLQVVHALALCSQTPFLVRYASNLNQGDSYVNITNTGTALATGGAGDICANAYVFDPSEEMVSCCSCLVTPNALVSLSVQNDLIGNTLSPSTPTSVVIKLLASSPAGAGQTSGTSSTVCDPTSIGNGSPQQGSFLVPGMHAWGTTLHALPGGTYGLAETDFSDGGLSPAELAHLTTFCGFINSNGSGFGICKSCRAGGLGGAKN